MNLTDRINSTKPPTPCACGATEQRVAIHPTWCAARIEQQRRFRVGKALDMTGERAA
jgi:hypothetical protein